MDTAEALRALKIDRAEDKAPPGGKRRLATLLLVVAALAGGGFTAWKLLAAKAMTVVAATVETSGGPVSGPSGSVLNASGYVVAELSATVSSQVTGMLRTVLVNEGAQVARGQVLAYLDDAQAKAGVETAESQLQAQRATMAQMSARLAQDELALERVRKMIARQLASQMDFDNAKADVAIDQASLQQATAQVAVAQSNLAAARILQDHTIIRAPFSGVITEKYAHPGEMISPAAVGGFTKTGVCQLVDMNSLEINVDINEAFIERVQQGMHVEAALDAYPDWRIPAHVINVVPTANRQKATVRVRIAFDKLDPRIVPEMGVQVWFYGNAADNARPVSASLLVPAEAVQGQGNGHHVFLVREGRAVRQDVVVGPGQGGKTRILSGLSRGEQVIVSSPTPLSGGERVAQQK